VSNGILLAYGTRQQYLFQKLVHYLNNPDNDGTCPTVNLRNTWFRTIGPYCGLMLYYQTTPENQSVFQMQNGKWHTRLEGSVLANQQQAARNGTRVYCKGADQLRCDGDVPPQHIVAKVSHEDDKGGAAGFIACITELMGENNITIAQHDSVKYKATGKYNRDYSEHFFRLFPTSSGTAYMDINFIQSAFKTAYEAVDTLKPEADKLTSAEVDLHGGIVSGPNIEIRTKRAIIEPPKSLYRDLVNYELYTNRDSRYQYIQVICKDAPRLTAICANFISVMNADGQLPRNIISASSRSLGGHSMIILCAEAAHSNEVPLESEMLKSELIRKTDLTEEDFHAVTDCLDTWPFDHRLLHSPAFGLPLKCRDDHGIIAKYLTHLSDHNQVFDIIDQDGWSSLGRDADDGSGCIAPICTHWFRFILHAMDSTDDFREIAGNFPDDQSQFPSF